MWWGRNRGRRNEKKKDISPKLGNLKNPENGRQRWGDNSKGLRKGDKKRKPRARWEEEDTKHG